MKLVMICGNYAPYFEGGTERVVRAQARELAALGHEVSIISGTEFTHRGDDIERAEVDGLSVAFIPRLETEYYDVHYTRPRLTSLVLEEARGADWVHVHHWFPFTLDLVRSLASVHAVAITYHDLFATCPRFFRDPPLSDLTCPPRGEVQTCMTCTAPDIPGDRPREVIEQSFHRRVEAFEAEARAATLRLAPSQTHAERVRELLGLPKGSVEVLPHGLCESPVNAKREAASIWDGSRPLVILHPGHRTSSKGTLDLVMALRELPAGSIELVLAGTEVEAGFDDALDLASKGLPIRRLPRYQPDELPAILAGCDMVALPSRAEESYGLVLDEALAAGCPAWVSDRGALFERVGQAGRVLAAENPAAWAEAFTDLLIDPKQHQSECLAIPASIPTAKHAALRLAEYYQQASS
ncbi:MAG: glycosyltransferase involved in cell wall biosynthesis [Planctomycetota bacterium]|jgi:glycosyltransferase involved in cell wall biosynthesis